MIQELNNNESSLDNNIIGGMPKTSQSPTNNGYPSTILGFDPGRQKCGLAVMGVDQIIHCHEVVSASRVIDSINMLRQTYPISLLVS